jgi:hypothetical protein
MPIKKPAIVVPQSLQSAADAASAQPATSSNAYLSGSFSNDFGLKDANGKPLPAQITGQQLIDAFRNYKVNGPVIEQIKITNSQVPGVYGSGGVVGKTGTVSPDDVLALTNLAKKAYVAAGPTGTSSLQGTLSSMKDTGAVTVPYSRVGYDQPNVEASKNVINDIFTTLLGRRASDKEIQTYSNAYLKYAAANPTNVESGTTSYGQSTSSTSLSRGAKIGTSYTSVSNNLTEPAFIQNQVKQSGEYNAFEAAGKAFDNLTSLARQDSGAA